MSRSIVIAIIKSMGVGLPGPISSGPGLAATLGCGPDRVAGIPGPGNEEPSPSAGRNTFTSPEGTQPPRVGIKENDRMPIQYRGSLALVIFAAWLASPSRVAGGDAELRQRVLDEYPKAILKLQAAYPEARGSGVETRFKIVGGKEDRSKQSRKRLEFTVSNSSEMVATFDDKFGAPSRFRSRGFSAPAPGGHSSSGDARRGRSSS